jgi:peptidoglycan-associated lipoprotein
LEVGGGINYLLTPRFSVRAIDADWLRTQLPNATTNVQNNLRLGAGIVYRIK